MITIGNYIMPDDFVAFSGTGNKLGGNKDGYRGLTPNQAAGRAAESRALYQPKNILGITGTPGNDPTVYYKRGNTFGHITTDHPIQENIGREIPRTDPTYTALNSSSIGSLQESTASTGVFHTSRNPLDTSTAARTNVGVQNAHKTFTGLKALSDPDKHRAVMDDIRSGRR
jgi:hypothetical protein